MGCSHRQGVTHPGKPSSLQDVPLAAEILTGDTFCRGKRGLFSFKIPLSTEFEAFSWNVTPLSSEGAFQCWGWHLNATVTAPGADQLYSRCLVALDVSGAGHQAPAHTNPLPPQPRSGKYQHSRLMGFGRRSMALLFISSYLGTLQLHLHCRAPVG